MSASLWKKASDLKRPNIHEEEEDFSNTTTKENVKNEPMRKKFKTSIAKNSQEEYFFDISSKRRITVREWKNTVLVDIREFYTANDELKPGKKGISLSADQWHQLVALQNVIDKAISHVKDGEELELSQEEKPQQLPTESNAVAFRISAKRRVTIKSFKSMILVDIREYYGQGEDSKPGKKGISLSFDQWKQLISNLNNIEESMTKVL